MTDECDKSTGKYATELRVSNLTINRNNTTLRKGAHVTVPLSALNRKHLKSTATAPVTLRQVPYACGYTSTPSNPERNARTCSVVGGTLIHNSVTQSF